jgi:ion channel-forming bestrophin family protein
MLVQPRRTWLHEIFTYRGTVLPTIWRRLLFVAGLSLALTLGHIETHTFVLRDITPLPFTLTGFALSVFLGFRTTTAYNRFWEGRTLWGALVNTCRNFTRQVQTWVAPAPGSAPDEAQLAAVAELRRRLVHHTIAFGHALRQRLRDQHDPAEYAALLDPPLRDALAGDANRPQAITAHMARMLREAYDAGLLHAQHVPVLEASLTAMTDVQGGCERIGSTPLPYVYRVLVHQIVGLYCFSLPFGLIHTLQWFAPAVTMLVAYAFFGLDAIGEELDNPFEIDANDLPLAALTRGIEIDLRARLGETTLPEPARPHRGLLL